MASGANTPNPSGLTRIDSWPRCVDPTLPQPDREGPGQRGAARHHRRGLDEHGAPVVWYEASVLATFALGIGDHRRNRKGVPAQHDNAVGGIRSGLQSHSREDGRGDRGLRVFQSASETAIGLSAQAAGPRAGFPNQYGSRELFLASPGRRRPQSGTSA